MAVVDDRLQWRGLSTLFDQLRDIELTQDVLVDRGVRSHTLNSQVLPSDTQPSSFDMVLLVLVSKFFHLRHMLPVIGFADGLVATRVIHRDILIGPSRKSPR